jgi:hypothetical protein
MLRLVSSLLLLAAACGSSTPHAAPPAPIAAAPAPAPPTATAATVTLKFGPLTSVMDIPRGQLEKGEHLLRDSAMVRELTALGFELAYAGDVKLAGDLVVVTLGDLELGRTSLQDLRGKEDPAPAAILDAAKVHAPKK